MNLCASSRLPIVAPFDTLTKQWQFFKFDSSPVLSFLPRLNRTSQVSDKSLLGVGDIDDEQQQENVDELKTLQLAQAPWLQRDNDVTESTCFINGTLMQEHVCSHVLTPEWPSALSITGNE